MWKKETLDRSSKCLQPWERKQLSEPDSFFFTVSSHKTFRIKRFLAKKQKQNQSIPQWIWMKTGDKIRYNSKRRHLKKAKLGLQGIAHDIGEESN
ncbi:large ribosomal subunit protein eL39-like [Glossophaga mutica]